MFPYAITIFSGAFLLFLVQPLIAGYVLPWFGGGPGVWTSCMVFFQVLLLGGHWYAHLLSRLATPRIQVLIHLALLNAALALLPITPADSWKPASHEYPGLQIIALLTATIGLPYFAIASTSPLMQHWFSYTNRIAAPFRLYALSNLGSMLALISYPVLFETRFTRTIQAELWGLGLLVYVIASGVCALKLWRATKPINFPGSRSDAPSTSAPAPTSAQKGLWLMLSACASILLLATTNKMCQDVAVLPFLWILPLALFLLSYVICFDRPRWYIRAPFAVALILSWGGVCWAMFAGAEWPLLLQLSLYAANLFICCMICHGELYLLRPAPEYLTGYYLMMAAGGALGGMFVAVVAPLVFADYFEFQWGLLLCGALFLFLLSRNRPAAKTDSECGGQAFQQWRHLVRGALAVGLAGMGAAFWTHYNQARKQSVQRVRNFYGVMTVQEGRYANFDGGALSLTHGQTLHGLQFKDPPQAAWPTTYYTENSGVGLCLNVLPVGQRRIGLIGLGVGTLATYAQAGDYLHAFEINPQVLRLASSRFTYLANCRGKVEVTLGDARLSLERAAAQSFDLLVLDAFNSDAIPVHLLTKEAFVIYQRHLRPNGVIAVHISNKSVNLEPVIAQIARHLNYQLTIIESTQPAGKPWIMGPTWALLCRNRTILDAPALRRAARPLLTNPLEVRLWTDDFASLFQILGRDSGLKEDSDFTKAQSEIVFRLHQQNDFAGAIACLRNALKIEPNRPMFLNDLAMLLFTSPDASLRSVPEALGLAEKACRLTRYLESNPVSTLAAIYAEAGRFTEAAVMAEKASLLASESGDQAAAQKYQELSAWFGAGHTYHESLRVNATNASDRLAP